MQDDGIGHDHPQFVEFLRANEERTGHVPDLSRSQLLARATLPVPPGALGLDARMDLATGRLSIAPLWTVADTSGESGCIVTNTPFNYGYAKSGVPPPVGDHTTNCRPDPAYLEHAGGIHSERLICLRSSQYCFVYAYGVDLATFHFETLDIQCTLGTATVAEQTPPATNGPKADAITDGTCYAYGSASNGYGQHPYYGVVYGFPSGPDTLTIGMING